MRKDTGPVHYAGAGRQGLAFACYFAAFRRRDAGGVEAGPGGFKRYALPMPNKTTSLDKVTCRMCWREIAEMAEERRSR